MGLGLHTGAWEYGLEALGWELTSLACFFLGVAQDFSL